MADALRRYADEDASSVSALTDAVYPEYRREPRGFRGWPAAEQFEAGPPTPYRHVAVDGTTGRIVGYGGVRTGRLPWARIDLMVHPAFQRRGIGGRLSARLEEDLAALGAITAQARVRADHLEGLAFLSRRGFAERHRMDGLWLDVATVDPAALALLVDTVEAQGIEIVTWGYEQSIEPERVRKLHALENAVRPDWADPDPAPLEPVSFEAFEQRAVEAERVPDALFLARVGDAYVGYSGLVGFSGTAVRAAYRRRGIATALKALVLADAQRRGLGRIITCTANPAMRAINERLGYRLFRTEVRLIRWLRPTRATGAGTSIRCRVCSRHDPRVTEHATSGTILRDYGRRGAGRGGAGW